MERRRFLASVSTTVPLALAGCMGGQDDDTSTTTTGTTQTTESTMQNTTQQQAASGPLSVGEAASLSGGRELAVVDAGASAFVVTRGDAENQVHATEDERYVRVKYAPTGIEDYKSFVADNVTVTVNGRMDSEDTTTLGDPIFPIGGGPSRFDAAYSIPTDVTPYTATVELQADGGSVAWEFGAEYIEAITQSVDYTVGSLSAPDAVAGGDSFTAELPVENKGDEITFYAVLTGTANAPTRVSETLPSGEETTIQVDATAPEKPSDAGDDASFQFALHWGHGEASADVAYE
ncbi:MAG: hypothetical protein ABEH83_10655 [Halobacterium sp.]